MPPWQDAVEGTPDGVRLLVEVTPRARADLFPDAYNAWRNRIGVRVRAAAQRGEANAAVVATVAAALGVRAHQVEVVSGHLDSRKDLLVRGLARDAALAALEPHLRPEAA